MADSNDRDLPPDGEVQLRMTLIGDGIKPGVLLVRALRDGDQAAARQLAEELGVESATREDLETIVQKFISIQGDETGVLIAAIASNSAMSIDDRARWIMELDERWVFENSIKWGVLLDINDATFRQKKVWAEIQAERERSERERRERQRRQGAMERETRTAERDQAVKQQFDDLFRNAEQGGTEPL